jgi:hypothetical protein
MGCGYLAKGYSIPDRPLPLSTVVPLESPVTRVPIHVHFLWTALEAFLMNDAIEIVVPASKQGYYSPYFLSLKQDGG